MTEDDFKYWLIGDSRRPGLARVWGWLIHHDRPARTKDGWRTAVEGHAGFPDLILARDRLTRIVELKADKGRLTIEQDAWLVAFTGFHYRELHPDKWARGVGPLHLAVHVWRPKHRPIIEELLR
jgi:hypothetical protein